MAFEYVLTHPCKVKDQYDALQIIEFSKKISYLAIVEDLIREKKGEVKDNDEVEAEDGEKTTIGDLRSEIRPLLHLSHVCRTCPANLIRRTFEDDIPLGCHGTIHYPISVVTELLVMEAVKYIANKRLYQREGLFVQYLMDHDLGERVRDMRSRTGLFFERPESIEVEFFNDEHGRSIDSDAVFDFLLGFNVTSDFAEEVFLPFFHVFEGVVKFVEREDPSIVEDRSLMELRTFGNAMRIAAELKCGIDCYV